MCFHVSEKLPRLRVKILALHVPELVTLAKVAYMYYDLEANPKVPVTPTFHTHLFASRMFQ